MNYIYNDKTKTYTAPSIFDSSGVSKGDPVVVIIAADLDLIFSAAKKRTAIRGRFAIDQQGNSLLDKLTLTDDERDWFEEIIKNGGTEIFKKLSAWTKGISSAYRHNVKFGNPEKSGKISLVNGAVITDSSKNFAVDELKDKKLIITSAGSQMNQERLVSSNTATTITLASPFDSDITAMNYCIVPISASFALFHLNLDLSWDLNLIQGVGTAIEEALVLYTLKEWYRINRNADDFQVEEGAHQLQTSKIRSQLLQYKIPARRVTDFFM
jgi:hypothetical protein